MTFNPGDPVTASWGNTVPTFANSGDNGKKIQTGTASVTITSGTNVGSTNVTWPTAFGSTPMVVAIHQSASGGTAINGAVRVTAKSTTAATFAVFRTDGTNAPSNQTEFFDWIAIG